MESRKGILSGISPQARAAFLGALLCGLAAHGMGLTNKFSTHDDIMALFWTGSTIASGRWMLHVVGWLEILLFGDGHFSLPVMNGLFSLCCIGLAAALITDLLKIRSRAACAGLGGIMAAFPAMAGLFGYMFTVPYYMLAMIMTVGAAWLICRKKAWWAKAAAILLGGCAVGIYQAFLPMVISLALMYDLKWLAEENGTPGDFLKKAAGQVLCVLGIMALYFAANRFFVAKFQVEMNSYMGIDQVGSTSLSDYLRRVGTAYREFFLPTRNVSGDMYPMHAYYVYLAMATADVILGIRLAFRTGRKNGAKGALAGLVLLLLPLGCNFIYVMSGFVHGLMTFSQAAQAALFAFLSDRTEIGRPKLRRAASGLAAAAMGLMIVMYARYDNQCYLKTAFQQQEAISWYTTLATRIKSVPGYREDLPVAFLNGEEKQDLTLYNIGELDFIHEPPYGDDITGYLNTYAWRSFMERWCGFGPAYADPAGWADREETRAMPHYPDDGSIRIIDGTVVVNF